MEDWWFIQACTGGAVYSTFTCIFDFDWWAYSRFQGTPPWKDIHYIQDIGRSISGGCNLWLWVHICFIFLQTTPTKTIHQTWNLIIACSVFSLFNIQNENFHECHFDTFYMNKTISFKYFTQKPKNINLEVVCCGGGWGIPEEILHREVTDENANWLVSFC